jgi:hypothetical protein
MRTILFIFFFIFTGTISNAQVAYPYQDIKLEKPADYKATESLALSAATFLLNTPFLEVDINRGNALKFLNDWMNGTKDYQFYFRGKATDISIDRNLLSLYIAAMAKYSLENKTESVSPMKVELNASKLVLAYCDDPKNNFKLKNKYRKILEKN